MLESGRGYVEKPVPARTGLCPHMLSFLPAFFQHEVRRTFRDFKKRKKNPFYMRHLYLLLKQRLYQGVVVHVFNSSTWDAES